MASGEYRGATPSTRFNRDFGGLLLRALFAWLFGVTRTFEQPALDAVGVPVVGVGFLYAGFKTVSAVAGGGGRGRRLSGDDRLAAGRNRVQTTDESPTAGALASNPSAASSSANASHRSPWFTSTVASR